MTLLSLAIIFTIAATLSASVGPEVAAIARGRHFAGIYRYLHDDAGDAMRPGDRAWVRSATGA